MKTFLCIIFTLFGSTAFAADQTNTVKPFNSIKITGPFKVIVSRDNASSLAISGDQVILPWVISSVKNGQLIVSMKPGVRPHYSKQLILTIKTPTLSSITGSNNASIQAKGLLADNLTVGLDNHSSLKAEDTSIKHTTALTLVDHSRVEIDGVTHQLVLTESNHSEAIADDFDSQNASITLVNHSSAKVSSQTVVANESNHSSLKLSEGLKKITGHLQNHSSIDAPKEETIQSFINDDGEFSGS